MSSPNRVGERPHRRKKQSEVVDSLISRRRSRFSKQMDRHAGSTRRAVIIWAVCLTFIGIGVAGLAAAALYVVSGVQLQERRM
jgi:hypothetical protein